MSEVSGPDNDEKTEGLTSGDNIYLCLCKFSFADKYQFVFVYCQSNFIKLNIHMQTINYPFYQKWFKDIT